jgi:hypothetical protein
MNWWGWQSGATISVGHLVALSMACVSYLISKSLVENLLNANHSVQAIYKLEMRLKFEYA